jgi:CheY-like chemotaxis protein
VVVGDMTRLRQILVNLLTNAVKFTSVGEVVVSVASEPDASGLAKLKFAVTDTGIGIPIERMDRLFRSFSQVDASTTRQYGGTGLGLAISKKLCELMGGKIWAESQPGEGSTFHFSILALPAAASLVTVEHEILPALQGKRILIVDDNEANLRILTRQLKSWNLQSFATKSPKLALELILGDENFDAGIIDMVMPDMDGMMLAREIRKHKSKKQFPLLMLTSMGKRERAQSADEEVIDAFLTKPIKQTQLADALNRLLDVIQSKEADQPCKFEVPMNQVNQNIRILIAEDNPTNQKVAIRMLSKLGYRADVVANGLEAIEAVRGRGYNLVFMDMQMPELDGLEATREIRKMLNSADTPWIVAMTANALRGDRERCLESGMNDYISKPVQIENLRKALERCTESLESSSDPEESDDTVLDKGVIAQLRELNEEGDSDIVAEMMSIFLEDAPPRMNGMHDSYSQKDAMKLREYSHSLKGSLTTLGATRLATICIEIEDKARAASLDGVSDLLKKADVEFDLLKKEMQREIQGSQLQPG